MQLARNSFLTKAMRELASLPSLIVFLDDSPALPSCRGGEHAAIAKAIARKDSRRAVELMLHHRNRVEGKLALQGAKPLGLDLGLRLTRARPEVVRQAAYTLLMFILSK